MAVTLPINPKKFREKLNLTQEQLARILGVAVTSVSRWESNRFSPCPLAREKLEDLELLSEKIADLEEDPALWFHSRNQALRGQSPLEIAMTRGGIEKIKTLLGRMEWGIAT